MTDAQIVQCPACGTRNRLGDAAAGTPRCGACHDPLPWITTADDDSFAEVAESSRLPVLIDLWAPWCGPCRVVSPAVEELGRRFAGRLKVVKVNVDVAPRTAARFNAMSIPTLLLVDRGAERSRRVGALPPPQLGAWVEAELAAAQARRTAT